MRARTNVVWKKDNLTSVAEWWHSGATLLQISSFMGLSTGSIESILRKMTHAYGASRPIELRAYDPDDVVARFISYRTMHATTEARKVKCSRKEQRCKRNQRFLARLAYYHDHMFNGQPVPNEARERARAVLGRAA